MNGSDNPNEQRRYDGAPAPKRNVGIGIGDAKAAAEDARRDAECAKCGHGDTDDLERVKSAAYHSCTAHQKPPQTSILLCSDCRDDHWPELEQRRDLSNRDGVWVLYTCGIGSEAEETDPPTIEVEEQVGWDDDGNAIMEKTEIEEPHPDDRDRIPVECRCGAEIEEVFY